MKRWFVAVLVGLPFAAGAVAGGNHKHSHGHDHDHEHEHRQLGAHKHGSGNFNIVIDGNKVYMELESPGADIVGFEYQATTDKQRAKVARAEARLNDIANVVALPAAAGCKVDGSDVSLIITGKNKEGSHSEFHAKYHMTCATPEKLAELTFTYFANFAGAQQLEVHVVGPKSQQRFEVERDAGKIDLGGVI